ncbi:hypothetical protein C8Q74DRAFT_426979 [Fomes fomentarius]|nr:hypothetical protein C8Q74DRAFT_426979 [Fomes fomentarius]
MPTSADAWQEWDRLSFGLARILSFPSLVGYLCAPCVFFLSHFFLSSPFHLQNTRLHCTRPLHTMSPASVPPPHYLRPALVRTHQPHRFISPLQITTAHATTLFDP